MPSVLPVSGCGDWAEAVGDALLPLAAPDHLVGANQSARRGEQDADGQFRHVGRVRVGPVGDHDAAPAGRFEVDPFVAGAVAAEQGEPWQSGHHGIGNADAAGADDRLHGTGDARRDVGDRGRRTVHVANDVASLGEGGQCGLGEVKTGEEGGTGANGSGHGRKYDVRCTADKSPCPARRKTGLAKNGTLCKVVNTKRPAAFKRI